MLIDVRESVEREINEIPGSVLIPKGDFQTGEALAELPAGQAGGALLQDRHPLGRGAGDGARCRPGRRRPRRRRRSAWVSQIDPSQPAY